MEDFKELSEYKALHKSLVCLALEVPEPVYNHVSMVFNGFEAALAALAAAPRPEALPPLQDAEVAELAYIVDNEAAPAGWINRRAWFLAKAPRLLQRLRAAEVGTVEYTAIELAHISHHISGTDPAMAKLLRRFYNDAIHSGKRIVEVNALTASAPAHEAR